MYRFFAQRFNRITDVHIEPHCGVTRGCDQVGTPLCIVVDTVADVGAFSNYKQQQPAPAAAAQKTPSSPSTPSPPSPPPAAAPAPPSASQFSIPSDLLAGPAVSSRLLPFFTTIPQYHFPSSITGAPSSAGEASRQSHGYKRQWPKGAVI